MDLAVLDEILQSCSKEARERLMEFMEALITASENKDEIIKQLKVEISNLKQQKRAKAVSDSARTTIAKSTASRADREAEQQRQAVQGSSNNEKRSREDDENKRRTGESYPKTRPRR